MTGPESANPAIAEDAIVPAGVLQEGELVILAIRPHGLFVLLTTLPVAAIAVLVVGAALLGWSTLQLRLPYPSVLLICTGAVCVRAIIACFQWVSRLYILTNRRVMWVYGISKFQIYQCPLVRIRGTQLATATGERMLGLGTLLFHTTDNQTYGGGWGHIARAAQVQQAVEDAVRRAGGKLVK